MTSVSDIYATAAAAVAPAAEPERKRRRRVCTVEIPAEIHALSVLTGRAADDIIADLLKSQVAAIRHRASLIPSPEKN